MGYPKLVSFAVKIFSKADVQNGDRFGGLAPNADEVHSSIGILVLPRLWFKIFGCQ